MRQLTVSELWIYPIKSLGGIAITSANVLPKGLQNDRRWMLIDEDNVFMTQRVIHTMALLKPAFHENRLSVKHGDDSIDIPANPTGENLSAVIWDDRVTVTEVDKTVSAWFSQQLQKKCRLVVFPENNTRPVDPRYAVSDNHVSLADAYPLLIIGQSSLDDLNTRLEQPVPMNRFRPNIVFTGGHPFAEDQWKEFQAGAVRFAGVKPCARCVLTTVDQETATRSPEPLLTLSKYRRVENKVLFGQNLIPLNSGRIAVGDPITL